METTERGQDMRHKGYVAVADAVLALRNRANDEYELAEVVPGPHDRARYKTRGAAFMEAARLIMEMDQ